MSKRSFNLKLATTAEKVKRPKRIPRELVRIVLVVRARVEKKP